MAGTEIPNIITVREAATRLGVTVRTLKYYEELGIVTPVRSEGRYRMYEEADLERLGRAIRLRSLGFSLLAITAMLSHQFEIPGDGGRPRLSKDSLAILRTNLASQLEALDARILQVKKELKDASDLQKELRRDLNYLDQRLAGKPFEAALEGRGDRQPAGRKRP